MWRAQAQNEEARLEVEKHVKCQGTARIRLSSLHFPWNKLRKLDPKNVDRLKSNFRKDCRRLEVRNHIPALIGQQQLDAALQVSGISAGTSGASFSGRLPAGVPPRTTPNSSGEGSSLTGRSVVDGGSLPCRYGQKSSKSRSLIDSFNRHRPRPKDMPDRGIFQ